MIQSFLRFIRMSGFEKEKSASIFLTSNSRSKIPFGQLERISGFDQLGTRFSLPSLAAWTQFLLDHLQSNLNQFKLNQENTALATFMHKTIHKK